MGQLGDLAAVERSRIAVPLSTEGRSMGGRGQGTMMLCAEQVTGISGT